MFSRNSLIYGSNLFYNRKIAEEFADEIECEKLVHYLRIQIDSFEEDDLWRDDFENRLKLLATKSKDKYEFLLFRIKSWV